MAVREKGGGKGAPLVAGSRQAWKVTLGLGALVVAAVASVLQLVGPGHLKDLAIAAAVASGALGIAALVSVRCPRCRRSLGVWAFRSGSLTTWHEALVEVAACPYCGREAEDGRAGGR
jgi:hypothetical protein